MIYQRLSVDADLGEKWLHKAMEEGLAKSGPPPVLYVPPALIEVGVKLCRITGCALQVDDTLPPHAWYLKGELMGIFSPGA